MLNYRQFYIILVNSIFNRGSKSYIMDNFDAIVRDISEYRNGDVLVTNEDDYIDKSDSTIVRFFERISYVEAATPRLSSTAEMEITKNGKLIEKTRIPVVGVDPFTDIH